MRRNRRSLTERFWEKVDVRGPDECWPWLASFNSHGYGQINGPPILGAHCVCWVLCFGPIPDGLYVLHACDFRPCCNPRCLFLGTHTDNMRDCRDKGRLVVPVRRGEDNGAAKLTAAQALEIRDAKAPQRALAAIYGVAQSQISNIRTGKTWKRGELACQ